MSQTIMDQSELIKSARDGDNDSCEKLISDNSGLIWSIARRYFGRGVDPDDLYQLGCVGFLKAIRGYDPDFGTRFSTYAVPKIAGEIRRFLRDDGTVKVSRGLKEQALAISQAQERLRHELGREPALSEISEFTGLSLEEIAMADGATGMAESLQWENGDDGLTLEGVIGVSGMEENIVERVSLREAVDALPERERRVVLLRFYRGFTQQKAARVMGVSQVQVSRIEHRAVALLRDMVT